MEQDNQKSIFKSANRFLSGTLLSRITGMVRDIAMAFSFGTGESVAALFVAYRLAHLLRRLLGEGALQSAFIPHFEELRSTSPEKAYQFFGNLYASLTLLLLGIVVTTMVVLGITINFWNLTPGNLEIMKLIMILMPSLLFICLFGLNSSFLQCEKEYWIPSLAPIGFNITWTLGALALWNIPASRAMPWLAGAIVCACMVQWMLTVPKTLKCLSSTGQNSQWKDLKLYTEDLKKLARPLMLGILGVAATQINNALDAIFARFADPSGPALLWYAMRILLLPIALFGVALSGALLPALSRAFKSEEHEKFHDYLRISALRTLKLIFPIMFLIGLLGDQAINLIYQRGDFTTTSTIGTTWCLWAYAIGILPMALILIVAPAFYAKKNYRIPTIATTVSVSVNLILNALLVVGLGFGAASVALATGITAWFNLGYLLNQIEIQNSTKQFLWVLFWSVLAAFCTFLVDQHLFGSTAYQILSGEVPTYAPTFVGKTTRLITLTAIFGSIYSPAFITLRDE